MRLSTSLLAPTLCFLALGSAESMRFAPAEDLVLAKSFRLEAEVTLTAIEASVNGEQQEIPELPEFKLEARAQASLSDRYLAAEDGRPTRFERTFGELGSSNVVRGPQGTEETERTSELEGRTVRFTWDADDEEYAAVFAEGDEDTDLLEDLRGDIDLLELMPSGDVEEGETWSPSLDLVHRIFDPVGELHLEQADDDEEDNPWAELMDDALLDPTGEFTVTWVRRYKEGGLDLIELDVVIDVEGSAQDETTQEEEGPMGPLEIQLDLTATLDVDMKGKMIWNATGNHFHSLDLEGTLGIQHDEIRNFTIMDTEREVKQKRVFEGTITIGLTTAVETE